LKGKILKAVTGIQKTTEQRNQRQSNKRISTQTMFVSTSRAAAANQKRSKRLKDNRKPEISFYSTSLKERWKKHTKTQRILTQRQAKSPAATNSNVLPV
jgi:hypothetical protein